MDIDVDKVLSEEITNEKQENAWQYVKQTILERQKEIEEIIEEQYQIKDIQVLTLRFTPTEFLFGEEGEYDSNIFGGV